MNNVSIRDLRIEIHRIQEEIRKVKEPLRQPWTGAMDSEQYKLIALRSQATELYTLRAWLRGKLHRTNPPEAIRARAAHLGVEPKWDAEEHAREIAERVAARFPREQAEAS